MSVTRAAVEGTKAFIRVRLGDPYEYGDMFTQNPKDGTDCSGVWNDTLGMVVGRFQWGREAEGATTESYRVYPNGQLIPVGGVGPFGTIRVARPQDIPPNAVAKLAFHHGGGGASSHMWGELDGMRIESRGGGIGLITNPTAKAIDDPYANAWAYLPGPIIEDGTAPVVIEPPDTLYADVSEWQVPVTDAYTDAGYRVLCIRSNDGTYRDKDWANNYAWCRRQTDAGKLAFFIVYFVWRPNWQDAVATLKSQVGQPHPKMAVMIDVESWSGAIRGDQSAGINAAFQDIAGWLGDPRRVIGYGNTGDLNNLWPNKPRDIRIVLAGYGSNPPYPGKIAHQYTDGQGYGGGLPEGAPPFGNCDMNSADGLTATAFAAALGITTGTPAPQDELEEFIMALPTLRAPSLSIYAEPGETDPLVLDMIRGLDAHGPHEPYVERLARQGDPNSVLRVARTAAGKGVYGTAAFAVNQAMAVYNEIAAAHPEYIQAAQAALAQKGA